jgi:photosystem II stability/assembly factor-like uncharacterized protein
LKSTDGGVTADFLNTETNRDITCVYFLNDNTGYFCGGYNVLSKTTNAGNSWVSKNNGLDGALYTVVFPEDESVGYTCGNLGIFKTTDGGNNWFYQMETTNAIHQLYFVDNDFGFASNSSHLYQTVNGGDDWNELTIENIFRYHKGFFKDHQTGFVTVEIDYNNSGIYKTTDGGASWELVFQSDKSIGSIQFVNDNVGFASGETFVKTMDGGTTWTEFPIPANNLGYIFFTDENIGYAAGYNNYIFKTTNGGGTITGIETVTDPEPKGFSLAQNFPNPFSQNTTIQFNIHNTQFVSLNIYDITGQKVRVLMNAQKPAGDYRVEFNATGLPAGIYFYRLTVDNKSVTKKLIIK